MISFLTTDFHSSAVEVIGRYARRWRIEGWFTEQLQSSFLDNLPSQDYRKNDVLDGVRIITSDVMKLFMNDVGVDYFRMFPKTFYQKVIKGLSADISIDDDSVVTEFDYFDEQYLLALIFKDMNETLEKRDI